MSRLVKTPKVELVNLREAQPLKEVDTLTYPLWGQALTFQQYRAREMILRETAHCRRAYRLWGAMVGDQRVASCETYALPFVYRGLRYVAWTIASIFVPEELRGRGYATALMKELLLRAKTERISICVGYTETGTALYDRLGFQPRPNFVARKQTPTTFMQWPAGVVPVDERSPLSQRSGTELAFVVDEAITFWHRARSHLYARVWEQRDIDVSGSRLRGCHVLWSTDWTQGGTLKILFRSPAPPEVGPRLMNAAIVHAMRYNLKQLEWWTTTQQLEAEPFADEIVPNPITPMVLAVDPSIPLDSYVAGDRVLWA